MKQNDTWAQKFFLKKIQSHMPYVHFKLKMIHSTYKAFLKKKKQRLVFRVMISVSFEGV